MLLVDEFRRSHKSSNKQYTRIMVTTRQFIKSGQQHGYKRKLTKCKLLVLFSLLPLT